VVCQDDFARKERVAKFVEEGVAKNTAQVRIPPLLFGQQLHGTRKLAWMISTVKWKQRWLCVVAAGMGTLGSYGLSRPNGTSDPAWPNGRGGDCGRIPGASSHSTDRADGQCRRRHRQHGVETVA
jgi:hypothetical protein